MRLVARHARDHPAQPRARRPRLPAGVARRAPRDFPFPVRTSADRRRASRARCRPASVSRPQAATGIAVKTVPDIRWARCDIKTVMLLPAVLAKEAARRRRGPGKPGSSTPSGHVTEGASSNAWIVDREGRLITRQIDNAILRGVTRTTLIDALEARGLQARSSAPSPSRRPRRRGRPSSPRRPISSCRWCASTARPIGNGAPGLLSLKAAARISFSVAEYRRNAVTCESFAKSWQFALAEARICLCMLH